MLYPAFVSKERAGLVKLQAGYTACLRSNSRVYLSRRGCMLLLSELVQVLGWGGWMFLEELVGLVSASWLGPAVRSSWQRLFVFANLLCSFPCQPSLWRPGLLVPSEQMISPGWAEQIPQSSSYCLLQNTFSGTQQWSKALFCTGCLDVKKNLYWVCDLRRLAAVWSRIVKGILFCAGLCCFFSQWRVTRWRSPSQAISPCSVWLCFESWLFRWTSFSL